MKEALYDNILDMIISRPRKEVPNIFFLYPSDTIVKTPNEKMDFKVKRNCFNLNDYVSELLYYKNFRKEFNESFFHKSTIIIKIVDDDEKNFYMYIKFNIKNDVMIKSRIVYSSSFNDLIISVYRPKNLPNLLNSYAFLTKDDTNLSQLEMINNHNNQYFMKELTIDGMLFHINHKKRTISTLLDNKLYSKRLSYKYDKIYIKELLLYNPEKSSVTSHLYLDTIILKIVLPSNISKEYILS
jgi:hypothetical protein